MAQNKGMAYDCYWCACEWQNGGAFWDVCECEPCCGKPCECYPQGLKCCVCWYFCYTCSMAKLFAYSNDQDCAILNHCVLACLLPCCVAILTRHNLRRKELIGDTCEYWWGDVLCICCCFPCALCQMCRSVKPDDWNWLAQVRERGTSLTSDDCKFWQPD